VGAATFLIAITLSTTASSPGDTILIDRVDLVEVNHFYDEQGRLVFDQLIFYDWEPEKSAYVVRAWRLLKTRQQIPQRDWSRGDYRVVWQDGDAMRTVRAQAYKETWTQSDPELINRKYRAKEDRLDLAKLRRVAK